MKQPNITVGVMAESEVSFLLSGKFLLNAIAIADGVYSAKVHNSQVVLKQNDDTVISTKEILLLNSNTNCSIELRDVTIGVDFHWEQKENQKFRGALKLIIEGDKVRVINVIELEDYLKSVISSEMSSNSSMALLKAHAVISRSWLLSQIDKSNSLKDNRKNFQRTAETEDEFIRWFDREDHDNFDVCADDHCQRYHGVTKIESEKVVDAVNTTRGEVLISDGDICDARFSKCCGGLSENFENVWEPVRHRCLTKVVDSEYGDTTCVDLRIEEEAGLWIRNKPHAFCNTSDKKILSQVLPDFDQTTTDFFRWKVEYSQKEISELIKKRSGIDFGKIIKLESIKRGHSSRIIKLKIIGTKKSLTIGKELVIRKWLSESHLYSSAIVIDYLEIKDDIPQKFIITGAGWGHGVGLCQIGAAVMGARGYSYVDILKHYYREVEIEKRY